MRIARVDHQGRIGLASIDGETASILTWESDHPAADALREWLASGSDAAGTGERFALAECRLLAPIARPSKIVAVGLNYADHAQETGAARPPAPLLFAKFPNTVIGPDDIIELRGPSAQIDYEGELGVVIGSRARALTPENALSCVFGYLPANDVSARDLQFGDGQWTRGKSLDTFTPLGPFVTTADDVPDPQALRIITTVNGVVLQDDSTASMLFSVVEILVHITEAITLEPGDVVLTGTPAGVGFSRTPPIFLRDGDEVVVDIAGLGRLRNVAREAAQP